MPPMVVRLLRCSTERSCVQCGALPEGRRDNSFQISPAGMVSGVVEGSSKPRRLKSGVTFYTPTRAVVKVRVDTADTYPRGTLTRCLRCGVRALDALVPHHRTNILLCQWGKEKEGGTHFPKGRGQCRPYGRYW